MRTPRTRKHAGLALARPAPLCGSRRGRGYICGARHLNTPCARCRRRAPGSQGSFGSMSSLQRAHLTSPASTIGVIPSVEPNELAHNRPVRAKACSFTEVITTDVTRSCWRGYQRRCSGPKYCFVHRRLLTGAQTGARRQKSLQTAIFERSRKPLSVVRRIEGSNPSPSA